MSKKPTWKIGDEVRIVEAFEYVRTGYKMYLPEVVEDLFENQIDLVRNTMKVAGIRDWADTQNRNLLNRFASAIAYGMIREKGFGGRDRMIIEHPLPDVYRGHVFEVIGKFYRMTGEYYGPSGGRSYDGDYDYEPGGLDKMVHNTILELKPIRELPMEAFTEIRERSNFREKDTYWTCVWSKRVENLTRPDKQAPTVSPVEDAKS